MSEILMIALMVLVALATAMVLSEWAAKHWCSRDDQRKQR
jgi:hypothetical protein